MTLAELIAALEAADPNLVVPEGFTNPHSYRGYYHQLAFEPASNVTVASMIEAAHSALGETFEGYKGGYYTMREDTDCWLASWGACGEEITPELLRTMLAAGSLARDQAERASGHTPMADEHLAEITTAAQPGHALILAQLIKHGAHNLPKHEEPVIIHGCTVVPASVLKEAVRVVWFGAPALLAEVERLRADLDQAQHLYQQAARKAAELQHQHEQDRDRADVLITGMEKDAAELERLRAELAAIHTTETDVEWLADGVKRIIDGVSVSTARDPHHAQNIIAQETVSVIRAGILTAFVSSQVINLAVDRIKTAERERDDARAELDEARGKVHALDEEMRAT
ncbi:hypothetical protein ACFQ07_27115, partial [Actinomadura adrarensis]